MSNKAGCVGITGAGKKNVHNLNKLPSSSFGKTFQTPTPLEEGAAENWQDL
jgi:hypothetical protein